MVYDCKCVNFMCSGNYTDTAAATAVFNGAFGLGVGTIQLRDVNCNGSEGSLLNCTRQGTCSDHIDDAGVECLGRPLRELCAF